VADVCRQLGVSEATHAQATIDAWGRDYNERRPHGSLGHLTPTEFAKQCQEPRSSAAA
jgi:putative transposase